MAQAGEDRAQRFTAAIAAAKETASLRFNSPPELQWPGGVVLHPTQSTALTGFPAATVLRLRPWGVTVAGQCRILTGFPVLAAEPAWGRQGQCRTGVVRRIGWGCGSAAGWSGSWGLELSMPASVLVLILGCRRPFWIAYPENNETGSSAAMTAADKPY